MKPTFVALAIVCSALRLAAQEDRFATEGVTGCLVLYDASTDTVIRLNGERCARRFIPASTFKIFNSLVSLEVGAIADEYTFIPWDSVVRWNPEWNRDMSMRDAFRVSCVPCYQTLARSVGEVRMNSWLKRENYGNGNTGGGIDRFWLSGELRISADEQIALLRKLRDEQMGFSKRSMRIVCDMMLLDVTEDYTIRGKTGWATDIDGDRNLAWFVGWVEKGEKVVYFALNFSCQDPNADIQQIRNRLLYGYLLQFGMVR